ncbi:hypothetical protein CR513_31882, partial [Mucuna pruriens]
MWHYRLGHPYHEAFNFVLHVALAKYIVSLHMPHAIYNSPFELLFCDLGSSTHGIIFQFKHLIEVQFNTKLKVVFKLTVKWNFELSLLSLQCMELFIDLCVHTLTIRMVQLNESTVMFKLALHSSPQVLGLCVFNSNLLDQLHAYDNFMDEISLLLPFEPDPHHRPYNQHKLIFHSKECIFLNYSSFHKGYTCLAPDGRICFQRSLYLSTFTLFSTYYHLGSSSTILFLPLMFHVCHNTASATDSSTSSFVPPTIVQNVCHNTTSNLLPFIHLDNIHPMQTRGKSGIVQPRLQPILLLTEIEPIGQKQALAKPKWVAVMFEGYQAMFGSNKTLMVPFRSTKPNLLLKASINNQCWHIKQIDVNNAFLNGILAKEVYMQQPLGFKAKDKSLVCKLNKAIYGLK